ncbi:unnamed protein product, partial [Allacma fusca]
VIVKTLIPRSHVWRGVLVSTIWVPPWSAQRAPQISSMPS